MDQCNCCKEEFEELYHVCYHCGEQLCDRCHSNFGGMCEECSELYND